MIDTGDESAVLRTGRPLDADGDPTDGPALELDPEGRAATLLADAAGPLVSSPGAGTWAALLERPGDGETDRPVLFQWLAPNAAEPPPHVHPTTETFEAVTGELTVVLDGDTRRLAPGESVTVDPGVEHAFRNDTGETVAFRAELPSMRTVETLFATWGLDHEGAFGNEGGVATHTDAYDPAAYGEPGPVHGLLLAAHAYDETVTTSAPVAVQRVLWATVAPVTRALGYEGVADRFLTDAFWERRVEQPPL